ncbi:teichuronic acid biosynthesis glycosyltransferase TuaG [Marinomonas polaris DSM 16579]|uniref:Teichuronic acid biosynthesis glycosyltransferase TuaG n=1 Tax=Marinomonas polaris DSM 16579 TaxID=1122206 RepID=A0A1M5MCY0_9GAMM|nr:glycosyltransferase family 2 protein [Marinomonas polaris]SHG75097.1 teichuronic acid biosynthesis glycosyltransferase TuaG [Marinomonas polaris DSM 16579]
MLVSIVMPTYNSESFVLDSIQSVIDQTYTNWELIIVDDCSIDNTYALVESKFLEDERIKLYKNDINSGAGITRNKGLRNTSGDFIAFLDSDDIWASNKLSIQMEILIRENLDIIHTNYLFIDECGKRINGKVNVSSLVDLNSYMKNTEIGMSTAIINVRNVGVFSFDEMRTRQDTKLWISLLSQGYKSKGIDQDLVFYRVRSGQISKNKFSVALKTLKLYLNVKEIPLYKRIYNFIYYAINGVLKRMRSNKNVI